MNFHNSIELSKLLPLNIILNKRRLRIPRTIVSCLIFTGFLSNEKLVCNQDADGDIAKNHIHLHILNYQGTQHLQHLGPTTFSLQGLHLFPIPGSEDDRFEQAHPWILQNLGRVQKSGDFLQYESTS